MINTLVKLRFAPFNFKFDFEIEHLGQGHVFNAMQLSSVLPFVQRF